MLQKTDKFKMHKFHHIEYWCPDATNAFKRYVTYAMDAAAIVFVRFKQHLAAAGSLGA